MKYMEALASLRGRQLRGRALLSDAERGSVMQISLRSSGGGPDKYRVYLSDGCGRRMELPDIPMCRGTGKMTYLLDLSVSQALGRQIHVAPCAPGSPSAAWGEFRGGDWDDCAGPPWDDRPCRPDWDAPCPRPCEERSACPPTWQPPCPRPSESRPTCRPPRPLWPKRPDGWQWPGSWGGSCGCAPPAPRPSGPCCRR